MKIIQSTAQPSTAATEMNIKTAAALITREILTNALVKTTLNDQVEKLLNLESLAVYDRQSKVVMDKSNLDDIADEFSDEIKKLFSLSSHNYAELMAEAICAVVLRADK